MRHFLTLNDFSKDELIEILNLAFEIKKEAKARNFKPYLKDQKLAMIFEKSSTRTRVSFDVGMNELGGHALFLSSRDIQLGRGEPIADTARVLSRYLDGIMIRTYGHERIEELARWADVPVINALSDLLHPCQALTDLLTIREHKGRLAGLKMAYVGDGNNMTHSLMYAAAKVGMHFAAATPAGYEPNEKVVQNARADASETGASVTLTHDPKEAVRDADVVVTDTWASMGQEEEHDARTAVFRPYQVNRALLAAADRRAVVMHCLPAYRGEEITADVFESFADVIFDEAENRLHVQKAIMALVMGG